MKAFIKEYFTFNRREQRGILVLLGIILALLATLIFLKNYKSKEKYDFTAFEKEIAALEKTKLSDNTSLEKKYGTANHTEIKSAERFNFDPNNLPENDWQRLGFDEKQIKTIKNYESKGGHFFKKEDLKKIYGITEALYLSLEPYIQIPHQTTLHEETENRKQKTVKEKIELNTADSTQLITLKGIGPVFAGRIIKYRNRLGGFISINQLNEVYGINGNLFDLISGQVTANAEIIEKININEADIERLKKHPYIQYKMANLIINYRNKHDRYQSINDLKKINALSDSVFTKMEPYLTVD